MKRLCILFLLAFALSGSGQVPTDTTRKNAQGIQRLADSTAAGISPISGQEPRKIKIIKKDVNYSSFMKLAIGMMFFIALIITTAQNYNPGE